MMKITEILFIITVLLTLSAKSYSQWSAPIQITENKSGTSLYPNVAVKNDGAVSTIWIHKNDFDDMNSYVIYRELLPTGFAKLDTLTSSGEAWTMPKLAMLKDGGVIAIWVDRNPGEKPAYDFPAAAYNVLCRVRKNGEWSKTWQLCSFPEYRPDIVVKINERGEAFFVVSGIMRSYLFKHDGENWNEYREIPIGLIYPDFNIDNNGKIELSYISALGLNDVNSIFFTSSDTTHRKWYSSILIQKGSEYSNNDLMFLKYEKKRHLIWNKYGASVQRQYSIMQSISDDGETWSMPEPLFRNDNYNKRAEFTSAANLGSNKLIMVWNVIDGSNYSIAYSVLREESWGSPIEISNKALYPSVCGDKNSNAHLVYMKQKVNSNDPTQIYYTVYRNGFTGIAHLKSEADQNLFVQNYPNPFNAETKIKYNISNEERVKIVIYNALGQEITMLLDRVEEPGEYTVTWKPGNIPSGIYFYRIETSSKMETKKMMYLK